jgi:hypothetical protein
MIRGNKGTAGHWHRMQSEQPSAASDLYHDGRKNATTEAASLKKWKLHWLTSCNSTLANRAQFLPSQPFVDALQDGSNFTSEMQLCTYQGLWHLTVRVHTSLWNLWKHGKVRMVSPREGFSRHTAQGSSVLVDCPKKKPLVRIYQRQTRKQIPPLYILTK